MTLTFALFLDKFRSSKKAVGARLLTKLGCGSLWHESWIGIIKVQRGEGLCWSHVDNHAARLKEVARVFVLQRIDAILKSAFCLISAREVEHATVVIASTSGYEGEEDRKQHQSFHSLVSYPSLVGGAR